MEVATVIKQLLISLFLTFSFRVDLSSCVTPEILTGPVTQAVPATQREARFFCHARASALFWYINDAVVFNSNDWITLYVESAPDFVNTVVTRSIGILTNGHNETKVECHATGDGQVDISDPAYLYVVEPPLPPSPNVTIMNETTLSVKWEEPFSWGGFNILSYSLNIRNETSSTIIETTDFSTSQTEMSSWEYVYSAPSVHTECHNLIMEVTANNSVGMSDPGTARGGFPIAVGDFSLSPIVEVTFTFELTPKVNVTFKPPMICWFQEGSYKIQIFDSLAREVSPMRENSYGGGDIPAITEIYESGIEKERDYVAVITAESLTGSSNVSAPFNTCINCSPQDVPLLTILNSTAIRVEWNRSASFQPNVEISYTLVVRNETEQFDLHEEVFNVSADFSSYPMLYEYNIESLDFEGCHNISFTILSSSSRGEVERPGYVLSGFPIAPSGFTTTTGVSFSPTLQPQVDISFEYPTICWYQSGTYKIQIFHKSSNEEVLSRGPITYRSTNNRRITESFKSGLQMNQIYQVRVTVETFGESTHTEVDFGTAIITPPTDPSTTSVATKPDTSTSASKAPAFNVGLTVGMVVMCSIMLALVICACVIIMCLRRSKIKAERNRRPPIPDVPNPLYETGGPIYEEIPGEKNFNTLLKSQMPTPCTEYVMIEGRVNGEVNHYDQLHEKEIEFEECKKLQDEDCSAKALGLSDCVFPEVTPGEDPYTFMNPAGTLSASKEPNGHCRTLPRNSGASRGGQAHGGHTAIRPSNSLPLFSIRVNQDNDNGDSGTPEERYVRRSLLT